MFGVLTLAVMLLVDLTTFPSLTGWTRGSLLAVQNWPRAERHAFIGVSLGGAVRILADSIQCLPELGSAAGWLDLRLLARTMYAALIFVRKAIRREQTRFFFLFSVLRNVFVHSSVSEHPDVSHVLVSRISSRADGPSDNGR